jgi:hypothetical protein
MSIGSASSKILLGTLLSGTTSRIYTFILRIMDIYKFIENFLKKHPNSQTNKLLKCLKNKKKEYGDLEDETFDTLTSFNRVAKIIDNSLYWTETVEGFYYYQFLHIRLMSGLALKLICDKKFTFARGCLQELDDHTKRCANINLLAREGKSYAEHKSQMAYYRQQFKRFKELLDFLEMNDYLQKKFEEKLESKKKVLKKFGS